MLDGIVRSLLIYATVANRMLYVTNGLLHHRHSSIKSICSRQYCVSKGSESTNLHLNTSLDASIKLSSKDAIHKLPRIHLSNTLAVGNIISLGGEDAHYVSNIMRLKRGFSFRVFNGINGEYTCSIIDVLKRSKSSGAGVTVELIHQLRGPDLESKVFPFAMLFAPIKKPKMKLLLEK